MRRTHLWKLTTKAIAIAIVTSLSLTSLVGCGYDDEEYYEDYDDSEAYDDYSDEDYSDEDSDYSGQGYDSEYDDDEYDNSSNSSNGSSSVEGFGNLGSASELAGTTVVVSVFADDTNTSWSDSDSDLKQDACTYLGIGCDWITTNASKYGCNAKFVYDWNQNDDLYYETSISTDLAGDDMDSPVWEYIDSNIDSASILSNYGADNIIYMIFVNTPMSNTATSCTRNYYDGMEYPYEICYMYMGCEDEVECPAAFAHEMLHTFGAPDLYMADEQGDNYGTTTEMVEYYESSQSNDIMYTTYDAKSNKPYYDHISNEFTELDAYYVGLTDSSSVAQEWGLESSQH